MSARKNRQGRRRDVSDVEMIRTGDSGTFSKKLDTQVKEEDGLAQPKGRKTRAAIANHLASKLKIGNMDLPELM